MSVRMTRGLPGRRSGYDQTKPRPCTRKSRPALSVSTTSANEDAIARTSSAVATSALPTRDRSAGRNEPLRQHLPAGVVPAFDELGGAGEVAQLVMVELDPRHRNDR